MGVTAGVEGVRADSLLASVAEQLKVPLTTIARHAELGQLTGDAGLVDAATIRSSAAGCRPRWPPAGEAAW